MSAAVKQIPVPVCSCPEAKLNQNHHLHNSTPARGEPATSPRSHVCLDTTTSRALQKTIAAKVTDLANHLQSKLEQASQEVNSKDRTIVNYEQENSRQYEDIQNLNHELDEKNNRIDNLEREKAENQRTIKRLKDANNYYKEYLYPEDKGTQALFRHQYPLRRFFTAYDHKDLLWDAAWKGCKLTLRNSNTSAERTLEAGFDGSTARTCQGWDSGLHFWRLRLSTTEVDPQTGRMYSISVGVCTEDLTHDEYQSITVPGKTFGFHTTHGTGISSLGNCSNPIGANGRTVATWERPRPIKDFQIVMEVVLDLDSTHTISFRDSRETAPQTVINVPTEGKLYPWIHLYSTRFKNRADLI